MCQCSVWCTLLCVFVFRKKKFFSCFVFKNKLINLTRNLPSRRGGDICRGCVELSSVSKGTGSDDDHCGPIRFTLLVYFRFRRPPKKNPRCHKRTHTHTDTHTHSNTYPHKILSKKKKKKKHFNFLKTLFFLFRFFSSFRFFFFFFYLTHTHTQKKTSVSNRREHFI